MYVCAPAYPSVRTQNGNYYIDDAQGSAQITGDTSSAREEARRTAYGDAVEQLISSLIPGIQEKASYRVILDKVLSPATGMVKNFRISSENVYDGVLTVTGSCSISEKSFDGLLGPQIISLLGNPRVMAVVDQPANKDKKPSVSPYEPQLKGIFEKAGYSTVDANQARTQFNLDLSNSYEDTTKLMAAARALRADIIIIAKTASSAAKRSAYGQTWYVSSGSAQVKALQARTSDSLGTSSLQRGSQESKSSSAGGIISSSINKAADEIIYKIAYAMASDQPSGGIVRVNVKITEASFNYIQRIGGIFRSWVGSAGDIFDRGFENGVIELDVVSTKTAKDIAAFLSGYAEIQALTAQEVYARAGVIRDDTGPVVQANTVKIAITVDNIRNHKDAQELENELKKFIGSAGKVENSYADPTASLTVTYTEGAPGMRTAQEISSFLQEQSINIDSVSDNTIKGWKRGWLW